MISNGLNQYPKSAVPCGWKVNPFSTSGFHPLNTSPNQWEERRSFTIHPPGGCHKPKQRVVLYLLKSRPQKRGIKQQKTEYRRQNTEYRRQNTEYSRKKTENRIQKTKKRIQYTEYRRKKIENRIQKTKDRRQYTVYRIQ